MTDLTTSLMTWATLCWFLPLAGLLLEVAALKPLWLFIWPEKAV